MTDLHITAYFINEDDKIISDLCEQRSASGWQNVAEFRKARAGHYKSHPREEYAEIPGGFRVTQKRADFGLRYVYEFRLLNGGVR